ncbi:peptidase M22 [Candidatus Pelagibacter sp.]|nr:peptidase M22 [Candidatus Pelagibacter sp.]
MNTLIINAADDKILFSLINKSESYTTTHINSRENFDKIMILILNFLNENNSNLDKITQIFVNQGPGKVSSIRNSIAIAKAIAFAKNIDLYGFLSEHLINKSVEQLVEIDKKFLTNINLIKPHYSS